MKAIYLLIASAILSLISVQETQAARARDLASAYSRARDKPIIAFCYGANFSKINEEVYNEFLKRRKLFRGINSVTYVEIPIYQLPDKNEKKLADKALGGVPLPGGIKNLPSIVILDSDKQVRGIISSSEEMKDAETTNAILKEKLDAFKKQQSLLKSAERFKTVRKAELVAEAGDLGLIVPAKYLTDGANSDKGGKKGYTASLAFNWETLLPEVDKMGVDGAINHIRGLLDNEKMTKIQRQELLCVLTGHIRRHGATADQMRPFYKEMYEIDPDSVYASYAEECIRTYCAP